MLNKGNIFCGYQAIGKSTTVKETNNYIDLESGNLFVDGKRDDNWYKVYVNIAIHMTEQGFNVFMSSHEVVRNELSKRNIVYYTISPSLELKDKWIQRLQDRYDKTKLDKDYRSLMNGKEMYIENVTDLQKHKNSIVIKSMEYKLTDIINKGIKKSVLAKSIK